MSKYVKVQIVGAGSVVTKSIGKLEIFAGNPAKLIGKRDESDYYRLKRQDEIYMKNKIGEKEY